MCILQPPQAGAITVGRQPLREELYVERLIASLAYARTADEVGAVHEA